MQHPFYLAWKRLHFSKASEGLWALFFMDRKNGMVGAREFIAVL
jgi:hypothetical protein